jgi:hypothetical protein
MRVNWGHAWPAITAAFLASLVEFLEVSRDTHPQHVYATASCRIRARMFPNIEIQEERGCLSAPPRTPLAFFRGG